MNVSVVVLTFNSERTLPGTLRSVSGISDDVVVVDSFSSDDTVAVARNAGARVVQHAFSSYGAQRNWAIDNLDLKHAWQLHLDADERVNPVLASSIAKCEDEPGIEGYIIARYLRFLGRDLQHGGLAPTWHLRLFRAGSGRCEERKYDQHFFLRGGGTRILQGSMVDDIQMDISDWTARHNRWSDAEVEEQLLRTTAPGVLGRFWGTRIERRRALRNAYNTLPLFVRPIILFIFRYVMCAGFLDGREGLIFWVLQTFWFRFLIDAKLFEVQQRHKAALQADARAA